MDYLCPASNKIEESGKCLKPVSRNELEFREHIITCRFIQNKVGFVCAYHIGHIFLSRI